MRALLIALPLSLILSACGLGDSGPPKVAEPYREGIQRAWELAEKGELPTTRCASVTGTAVGLARADSANRGDAVRAYEICYVDVHAHWVHQRLDHAEDAQAPCLAIMTGLMASRMSLGAMAGEFDLEIDDLNRRLANKIADRVEQDCPDMSSTMLGVQG